VTLADDTRGSSSLGLLQVCGAGVLWGTGGLVVTVLHEHDGLGAMAVSAWRMGIAAVTLVAFTALTGRLGEVRATVRAHPVLAALVGGGTALYQALYFLSVLAVGVSVSTVVSLGLAPIVAAAWEHAIRRTRPTARQAVVLATALAGLVLISLSAGERSSAEADRPVLGLVLAIASGATYAATTLLGHALAQRVDPVALTTCATTAGAVVLLPCLGVAAAVGDPVAPSHPGSWLLLVYLGVATMAVAYGLLYAGLRSTPGSAATVATLVEPLSAALLAVLLLGERLAWPAVLGAALLLTAVAALRPDSGRVGAGWSP
jgi:DME family drug/metabolite transporter